MKVRLGKQLVGSGPQSRKPIAIVDFNKWQATGRSSDKIRAEPLEEKFESFGWKAFALTGMTFAKLNPRYNGQKIRQAFAIIADTVKGKGIKMMEDDNNWHYRIPSKEEVDPLLKSLE